MALELGALRDALKEAGASDELARAAAEEVASYDNRLHGIDQQIAGQRAHIDQEIAALRAEMNQQFTELRAYVEQRFTELAARVGAVEARLTTMQWVLGFVAALEIAILAKLFVH